MRVEHFDEGWFGHAEGDITIVVAADGCEPVTVVVAGSAG